MSIVPMKKLRLIAVRSQREAILRELMLLGCVEVSEPTERPAEERPLTLRRENDTAAYELRAERSRIVSALRVLDRYAPASRGLLTPLPEVAVETLLDERTRETNGETAARILSLDVRVRSIAAQESRERNTIESMQPWAAMDQPLESVGTKTCELQLGILPAATTLAAAEAALGELEADITEVSSDKTGRWVAVVFRREEQERVLSALRSVGFSRLSMAGMSGTPQENIARSRARLEELSRERESVIAALKAEGDKRRSLQLGADTLNTCIARAETAERLLHTESTFYLEGWLSAPEEESLAGALQKYDCAWESEEPDPEHPEEVPIRLKNNRLTRPYNMVTEMYSLPAYNGLDPNPFIMPFFALFFGIMFADMAYGLLLFLGGLLLTVKARPRGTMKHMAGLLLECGVTTFIMGFLTNGFFGDAVSIIGSWFGKDWSLVPALGTIRIGADIAIDLPLNLLEGNNPLYVLIGAILLGAVHLAVGVGIGMYFKLREGQWADALLNDLCWWVMIAGLLLMVLGKGTTVLWIGVGMLVLGTVLTNKGLSRITGLFSAVYNGATGYLGDLLSYSRLMALMLAGSVIASVFNQLGSLGNADGFTVGGTILFIVVFCIGHVLNFGLNVIGCFVHTLRLQYLEFFGKWYRDGGRPFRPLTIQTNYFDIIKEDTSNG